MGPADGPDSVPHHPGDVPPPPPYLGAPPLAAPPLPASHTGAPAAGSGDALGEALLQSLARSRRNHLSLSPVRTGVLAWLTFGTLPLFKLGRQFRDFAMTERQQLWHVAEWTRTRTGREESAAVADAVNRIDFGAAWGAVSKVLVLLLGVVALVVLQDRLRLSTLIDATYRFRNLPPSYYADRLQSLYVAWNVFLVLAYGLHWLRVRSHAAAVARFADRFNAVARREGLAPLRPPETESGLRAPWVAAAVLLCWIGAWWSIPMVLAAAAQRQYINETGYRFRAALLERVRAMLMLRRPIPAVPQVAIPTRRCGNPLCKATLRANAQFCARCGTRSGTGEGSNAGSAGALRVTSRVA